MTQLDHLIGSQTDRTHGLNERQRKVLQRMLDTGPEGLANCMTNRIYVSLTRASRESAKRDLAELERLGLLKRNPGAGRSVSYALVLDVSGAGTDWW